MTPPLAQDWTATEGETESQDPAVPDGVFPVPGGEYGHEVCARKIFPVIAKARDLFVRGSAVTETSRDPLGEYILRTVTPERLVCKIESYGHSVARHETVDDKNADGTPRRRDVWRRTTFPVSAAKMALVSDGAREHLPSIRQLLSCPVAIREGRDLRILSRGWHRHAGGTLVMGGTAITGVPLDTARGALIDLLGDFSFQSPGDKSRAMAAFLSPALKFGGWIEDDFPLDLSEADKSQGGKTYRFKMIAQLYGCRVSAITNDPRGGLGSLDEKVSKALIEGRPFVSLQNIRGRVDSPILEEAIRGQGVVAARALREAADVDTRVFLWQLSTNGADLTRDLANRSVVTRIRKQAEGFKFRTYSEGDVVAHIKANSGFLLGCVFSILGEWARRGCPVSDETRHDFRGWVRALDYIVQEILAMPPIMENHTAEQERVGNPALQWLREVARAVVDAGLAGRPLSTASLIEPAEEDGVAFPSSVPPRGDEASYTRAGRVLKKAFLSDTDGDERLDVGEYVVVRSVVFYHDEQARNDKTKFEYTVTRK